MHYFLCVLTCNSVVASACMSSNTYSPVECVLRIPVCCVFNVGSFLCLLSVFLRTVQTGQKKDFIDNLLFSVAGRNLKVKHSFELSGP